MLTIRKDQTNILSQLKLKDFVNRMIAHLNEFFPEECQEIEQENMPEFVRAGINKAETYDITRECDVAKFVDLMVVLGRDFDTSNKVHWAGEILRQGNVSAEIKLQAVYEWALRENEN